MWFLKDNYKNFIKQFIFVLLLVGLVLLPYFVFAAPLAPAQRLQEFGKGIFKHDPDPQGQIASTIGTAINAFLSLLGIVFIILLLVSGYQYMISRGNEEKAVKALDAIRRAIVGLIIIVSAFAIWNFVAYYFIG